MNNVFSSLFAFVFIFSASAVSAQDAELYSPRGGNNLDNNGPRIVQEAQIFKGYGTRVNDNEDNNTYAKRAKSGAYYLKATVLIYGQFRSQNTKRLVFAKGRTKQEAMSNLRDQVNAIGANAQVIQVQFITS
jgi:hypothetical protein